MGYVIGIDLGTTFTAAAVAREGRAEIVTLGNVAHSIPSVVVLRSDGEVLVGEAAERRAQSEPTRTAREFKRRLGDPTPLLLGGTPYGAETLMAHLLRAVVAKVRSIEGAPPDRIAVCHPANYGPYKLDLVQQAVRIAEIGPASLIAEPVAAAVHYASQERVEPGEYVAVYDFGGGTFDAAVLRKSPTEFEMLGTPEGLERLGGIDFDQAVFAHVEGALGGAFDQLDDDDATVAALARLRDECREAKEALSADTDTQITVMLPRVQTDVRLTRAEFEALVRPRIVETAEALERAVRSAGIPMDYISRVLLVGGSSRIPLVGQLVREATGRPVAVDAHPKHSIALGAALSLPAAEAVPVGGAAGPTAVASSPAPGALTQPAADDETTRSKNKLWLVAALGFVVLASAAGAFAVIRSGDSASTAGGPTPAPVPTNTTNSTNTTNTTTEESTTITTGAGLSAVGGLLSGRLVSITSVRLDGDTYVVEFSAANFTPGMGAGEYHVHFYFSGGDPGGIIAGTSATGAYADYAGPSPFSGLSVADKPAASPLICASVADSAHATASLSGNCVAAPG